MDASNSIYALCERFLRRYIMIQKRGRKAYLKVPFFAVLVMAGGCLSIAASAGAEIHVQNDFSITANDVTGPGSDQSSLTEGIRYLNVFGMNGNGTLNNNYNYNFSVGVKATDDSRNDLKTVSLTNLQVRLNNEVNMFAAGDIFESFSQYALSTAVKGISYRYAGETGRLPEVTFIYGLAYPRWDNFYGVDSLKRRVYGARVKQNVNDDFSIGLSGVSSDDSDRENGSPLYDNRSITADLEYRPIQGLTLRAESSYASTEESPADGVPNVDSSGYAHKLEAIGDGGPSRVTLEYERVSADYFNMVGAATPDREKVKTKWRYKYAKDLTMNFGFLWYRDNLDGEKTDTAHHYKPEIGFTKRRLGGRQYAATTLTYKTDLQRNTAVDTTDHYISGNYRDRFGVFDSDTNLGYTLYDTEATREADEWTYNTALSSRHSLENVVLKPSLNLGGWTADDELTDTRDQIWEYAVGLGVEMPQLKVTSNFKVGFNRLDKQGGIDSERGFVRVDIYYRAPFLEQFNYGMLYLRANVNDFNYDDPTRARDFRESSLVAGLNIQL